MELTSKLLMTILTNMLRFSPQSLLKCLVTGKQSLSMDLLPTVKLIQLLRSSETTIMWKILSLLQDKQAQLSQFPLIYHGLVSWPAWWLSSGIALLCPSLSVWESPNSDTPFGPDVAPQVLSKGQWPLPLSCGPGFCCHSPVFAWSLPYGPRLFKSTQQRLGVGQCRPTMWLCSAKMPRRCTCVRRSTYGHTVHNFICFL